MGMPFRLETMFIRRIVPAMMLRPTTRKAQGLRRRRPRSTGDERRHRRRDVDRHGRVAVRALQRAAEESKRGGSAKVYADDVQVSAEAAKGDVESLMHARDEELRAQLPGDWRARCRQICKLRRAFLSADLDGDQVDLLDQRLERVLRTDGHVDGAAHFK